VFRLAEFGLDATLLAGTATAGWFATRYARRWFVAGTAVSLLALVTGALFEVRLYPWTDGVVLLFALSGGSLLASLLPARPAPLVLVLATLSVIDSGLFLLPAPTTASPAQLPAPFFFGNVVLLLPHGQHFVLGALDLLLAAALAAQARRRRRSFLTGTAPTVIGIALAFLVVALRPTPGLPLIPFFSTVWLALEIAGRLVSRRTCRAGD